MGPYDEIVLSCWLGFLITWAICAMTFKSGGRQSQTRAGRGIRLLLAVAVLVSIELGVAFAWQPFGAYGRDVAAAGAALCVGGLAFAIWARVAIGSNWGMPMTQHESPELVTSGPYRFVRHPIYTGLGAMMIGTALAHPFAALACACWVAYSVFSALREERDMEQRFPGVYDEYKRRSKMLVPFLL